jgi:hypothetical protein
MNDRLAREISPHRSNDKQQHNPQKCEFGFELLSDGIIADVENRGFSL